MNTTSTAHPYTPLAFPASTYGLRYGLGLVHVDAQVDASHRPWTDSHASRPYLYDLQAAMRHFEMDSPRTILARPKSEFVTVYVNHQLVVTVVLCVIATSITYAALERLLLRAGLLVTTPVFSRKEAQEVYEASLAQYTRWLDAVYGRRSMV